MMVAIQRKNHRQKKRNQNNVAQQNKYPSNQPKRENVARVNRHVNLEHSKNGNAPNTRQRSISQEGVMIIVTSKMKRTMINKMMIVMTIAVKQKMTPLVTVQITVNTLLYRLKKS